MLDLLVYIVNIHCATYAYFLQFGHAVQTDELSVALCRATLAGGTSRSGRHDVFYGESGKLTGEYGQYSTNTHYKGYPQHYILWLAFEIYRM